MVLSNSTNTVQPRLGALLLIQTVVWIGCVFSTPPLVFPGFLASFINAVALVTRTPRTELLAVATSKFWASLFDIPHEIVCEK